MVTKNMNNVEDIILEKYLDGKIDEYKVIELLETAEESIEKNDKNTEKEKEEIEKRKKRIKLIKKAAIAAAAGAVIAAPIIKKKSDEREISRFKKLAENNRKFMDEVDKLKKNVNFSDPVSTKNFAVEFKKLQKKYGLL